MAVSLYAKDTKCLLWSAAVALMRAGDYYNLRRFSFFFHFHEAGSPNNYRATLCLRAVCCGCLSVCRPSVCHMPLLYVFIRHAWYHVKKIET